MKMVAGIVENGKIEINQAIPAKNGTPVMIFVIPQHDEISHKQDLFGKWTWYDDDIEREVQNAWNNWAQKTDSL